MQLYPYHSSNSEESNDALYSITHIHSSENQGMLKYWILNCSCDIVISIDDVYDRFQLELTNEIVVFTKA